MHDPKDRTHDATAALRDPADRAGLRAWAAARGLSDDDLGQLGLVEADYAWITEQLMAVARRHAQGRVVSSLEGGYHLGALARSVAAHLRVLAGL